MTGLSAGDLDRRITFLRSTDQDDGTATVAGEPKSIGQRWAKKTDVSDGESVRAAQLGQTLTARFLVRSDCLTRTITGRDAIQCDGQIYGVIGTKEWGGRRVGIEITTASQPDFAS